MEFHKDPALHQAAHDLTMVIIKEKASQMTIGFEPEKREIKYLSEMYREIYANAILELQNE